MQPWVAKLMKTINFNKFQHISRNFFKGSSPSFTLIEIIIAIVVLSIGVFSVIALSGKSYGAISLQKNKLIALNLAKEETEIIRSARDENWLYRGDSDCDMNSAVTTCDGTGLCGDGVTPNETQTCEDNGDCDWRCGNEQDNPPGYQPDFILDENLRDIAIKTDPITGEIDGIEWITGVGATSDCYNDGVVLLRDNSSFIYQHTNGEDSPFRRLVVINRGTDLNGDGEVDNDLQITVIVCWQERGGKWQEISLEDHLYNWAH